MLGAPQVHHGVELGTEEQRDDREDRDCAPLVEREFGVHACTCTARRSRYSGGDAATTDAKWGLEDALTCSNRSL